MSAGISMPIDSVIAPAIKRMTKRLQPLASVFGVYTGNLNQNSYRISIPRSGSVSVHCDACYCRLSGG